MLRKLVLIALIGGAVWVAQDPKFGVFALLPQSLQDVFTTVRGYLTAGEAALKQTQEFVGGAVEKAEKVQDTLDDIKKAAAERSAEIDEVQNQ